MSRLLKLISGGHHIEVRKSVLITLDLFLSCPWKLNHPYTLSSNVSPKVLEAFGQAINGNEIEVTASNYNELSMLCKELGFHDLSGEIERVRKETDGWQSNTSLLSRLRYLEKMVEALSGYAREWLRFEERMDGYVKVQNDMNARLIETAAQLAEEKQLRQRESERESMSSRQIDIDSLKKRYYQPSLEQASAEQDEAPEFQERRSDGIFAHIQSECRTGRHGNAYTTVATTESPVSMPCEVLNKNWKDYMVSTKEPNSCTTFDFGKYSVCPTYYSLRPVPNGISCKNWSLLGSDDGSIWKVLDECDERPLFESEGYTFECQADNCYFRWIRIIDNEKRSEKDDPAYFRLLEVELFGKVRPTTRHS